MSTGIIIFSRLASKRLPGKALIDIDGRCLLGRVIDRAKLIKGNNTLIVATSINSEDDEIASFVSNEDIQIYRGDSDDVCLRALGACKLYKLKKFARVCGDRPFFDPDLISSLINIHNDLNIDLVTTTFPRTYPPGLTGEVISVKALQYATSLIDKPEDKEHITSFFYQNPRKFSIKNIESSSEVDYSGVNLCVDTAIDLERAKWVAKNLKNSKFDTQTIISLAKEWDLSFDNRNLFDKRES